jgi:hypothetical protein
MPRKSLLGKPLQD